MDILCDLPRGNFVRLFVFCQCCYTFYLVLQSEHQHRLKRQADPDDLEGADSDYNLGDTPVNVTAFNIAEGRSNIFSAVFLITLFITVSLGLALYAVSVMLWNMDPGRDSVIYRQVSDPAIRMQ